MDGAKGAAQAALLQPLTALVVAEEERPGFARQQDRRLIAGNCAALGEPFRRCLACSRVGRLNLTEIGCKPLNLLKWEQPALAEEFPEVRGRDGHRRFLTGVVARI